MTEDINLTIQDQIVAWTYRDNKSNFPYCVRYAIYDPSRGYWVSEFKYFGNVLSPAVTVVSNLKNEDRIVAWEVKDQMPTVEPNYYVYYAVYNGERFITRSDDLFHTSPSSLTIRNSMLSYSADGDDITHTFHDDSPCIFSDSRISSVFSPTFYYDGLTTPSFDIHTDKGLYFAIEVTTDNKLFYSERFGESRNDTNFFNSFWGSSSADTEGSITQPKQHSAYSSDFWLTLPRKFWDNVDERGRRIYYRLIVAVDKQDCNRFITTEDYNHTSAPDIIVLDNINGYLSGTPIPSTFSFDPTPDPQGPAGIFSFSADFCNIEEDKYLTKLESLTLQIIPQSNVLINRYRYSRPGIGSRLTFPKTGDFADSKLYPGECVRVDYKIGLAMNKPFQFHVGVLGNAWKVPIRIESLKAVRQMNGQWAFYFKINKTAHVTLEIGSVLGSPLAEQSGEVDGGKVIRWTPISDPLSSGSYFATLRAGEDTKTVFFTELRR